MLVTDREKSGNTLSQFQTKDFIDVSGWLAKSMWLLSIILLFLCVNLTDVVADSKKSLIWKPNDAGLYSHFFQTKYMAGIASRYDRTLSIAPYSDSTHAKDKGSIVLCDIFDFEGSSVSCLRSHNSTKGTMCYKYFDFLATPASARSRSLCFDGRVFGRSGIVPNATRLAAMNVGPKLLFAKKYVSWYESIRSRFIKSLPNKNNQYIVVHWRRGDQLTTRCSDAWKGARDYSVNCGSVSELVTTINAFLDKGPSAASGQSKTAVSSGSIDFRKLPILIATNEKNETILSELRSHHYTPMSDMISKHDTHHQLNGSLDEFIVESQFMLDATVLLTFGVSQINDVLENERMQRGLSFCAVSDPPGVFHHNWCTVYAAAAPSERNQPLPPPVMQADEAINSAGGKLGHRTSSGAGGAGSLRVRSSGSGGIRSSRGKSVKATNMANEQ